MMLAVSDNGSGMTEEVRADELFEPFFTTKRIWGKAPAWDWRLATGIIKAKRRAYRGL